MNFILKPSLEHIALVKVATLLWNQHDIRALVTEFWNSFLSESDVIAVVCHYSIYSEREEKRRKIEKQVIEKLAQLTIPLSFKEKMLGYIQSIGLQIFKWMKHHLMDNCLDLDLPNEFCWTPQGTINKLETAEVLIRDDSIDITKRYKLACYYCLEDYIAELWNKIPESEREFRYRVNDVNRYPIMELVDFWKDYIKVKNKMNWHSTYSTYEYQFTYQSTDQLNRHCTYRYQLNWHSTYRHQLDLAAESGNKAATEYFLQKLDLEEKLLLITPSYVTDRHNTALSKAAYVAAIHSMAYTSTEPPEEYYNEVLCFFISQMRIDQQLELFQQQSQQVVNCLLDWPFQSLFVETVKLLWNFLPKSNYCSVFLKIIKKEFLGYKDYNYREAFRDVWQLVPEADKSFIRNDDRTVDLLDMLLHVKDKKSIKLIFEDATLIEKSKFAFSEKGRQLYGNIIRNKEWDLVRFFVPLLISSKNEMIKFKQEMQEESFNEINMYVKDSFNEINMYVEDVRPKIKFYWDEFFRILDHFICGYDKRNVDEGETISGKGLYNVELKDVMQGAEK